MLRRKRRGFTLLEIIIALSIVALILTLGIPAFWRTKKRSAVRSVARIALENMKQARVVAGSGTNVAGMGIMRYGGIIVLSPTSYGVLQDVDTVPTSGNEQIIKVIDFRADDPDSSLTIVWNPAVANNVLYFESNAQVLSSINPIPNLVITDGATNYVQTIQVAQSGIAHIVE